MAEVTARNAAPLAPPQIAQALREAGEQRVVQRITVFAEPGRSAQVAFKPPAGQRRGQTVFVDPYTGALTGLNAGGAGYRGLSAAPRAARRRLLGLFAGLGTAAGAGSTASSAPR